MQKLKDENEGMREKSKITPEKTGINMRHHETIFSPDFLAALTLCAGISMELLPFKPLNSLAEKGCQDKPHFPEDMAESKRRGTKQKLGANLKQTTSYCLSPGKCELTTLLKIQAAVLKMSEAFEKEQQ